MAANDCDICREGRLEGLRRGAERGMHAELFYDPADSSLAIFTTASDTINNSRLWRQLPITTSEKHLCQNCVITTTRSRNCTATVLPCMDRVDQACVVSCVAAYFYSQCQNCREGFREACRPLCMSYGDGDTKQQHIYWPRNSPGVHH